MSEKIVYLETARSRVAFERKLLAKFSKSAKKMIKEEDTVSEPDFVMEELSDNEDEAPIREASYPVPKVIPRHRNLVFRLIFIIYLVSFAVYMYVRLWFTLDAPGINRLYCTFIAVLEVSTAPALIIHGLCLWRWYSRTPPEVDEKEHSIFHTTRILIPTFEEPLEVVSGTVREIINLHVPPGLHVHVYVLDDGARYELEQWVLSRRTKRCVYLHYVARPKLAGRPHHAKSGNINHILHYLYDDENPENECVVVFDADFMPKREFLLKVLPVFSGANNGKPIALVQTPQHFYNVNPDEDMWDHMNTSFFHRIEPSLDRWGAVNCCGTNFVIRSDSLKEAGYLPIGCLTEDTLLSLRLCELGWGVAYHHEILAVGQAPNEIGAIFKQRGRWCKGNMQIFLDEFPLMKSSLSLPQRVFYSSLGFNYICIAISTPIFQLIPVWAIFFDLWPISKINPEFAMSLLVYYVMSNVILLYPPVGFGIKDMWNGELASVNFWLTFFSSLKAVLASKIFGGDLKFETTEKKKDGETERTQVGFRMRDLRLCFMQILMLSIYVAAIVYAIAKAIRVPDIRNYYTAMIGICWTLMGMVPYVGVVIYCYYRVRIPGVILATLRNAQLVLRCFCIGLIVIQSFLIHKQSSMYNCLHAYEAELGVHRLTVAKIKDHVTGQEVERNAFWLLGVKDDFYTIEQIKKYACDEKTIPVLVFALLPKKGLVLNAEISHYLPDNKIDTWEEYDTRMLMYVQELKDIPSIIVMEPSLLMHTFNYEAKYWNINYQFAFFERIEVIVRVFKRSWVYIDAGNPLFLQWQVNLDYMAGVLEQLQSKIRGFSINVGSYVNTSLTTDVADALYCRTGLHYVIDTSRNGGMFSSRPMEAINDCKYDPPEVSEGHLPAWREGSKQVNLKVYNRLADQLVSQKRGNSLRFRRRADAKGLIILRDVNATCDPGNGKLDGLDAYLWVKTPGESDGRLFQPGSLHSCLLNHYVECSIACPQYVPKIDGKFLRRKTCQCVDDSEIDDDYIGLT